MHFTMSPSLVHYIAIIYLHVYYIRYYLSWPRIRSDVLVMNINFRDTVLCLEPQFQLVYEVRQAT